MNDSDSKNSQDQVDHQEIIIHVRDRRKPRQFIVDNLIMDEYFPIIGPLGYSIYSLLVRMSNERDGEQARASLRMMCAHLDIESRAVLGYYITLMEIFGLLFKDLPEAVIMQNGKRVKKKMGNRTNYYYILDVKPVTDERIKELKTAVRTNEKFSEDYRNLFLKKLDEWRPIQSLWRKPGKKIKTIVGQDELPLKFDDEDEDATPPLPSTLQDADPTSLEILQRLEITKPSLLQELGYHKPSDILALVWYGQTQSWMEEDRLSGYVIKNLGPDGSPPPKMYLDLARFWLSIDKETREEMNNWYFYSQREASQLAQELNTKTSVAQAALKLVSQDPQKNHLLDWLEI